MKIGVALAGGGLKGVAHIGALKALEELGIKISCIAGTSSGSLMAALFSCGYNFDEMKDLINKNYKILAKIEKRPIAKAIYGYLAHKDITIEGLSSGQKIEDLVSMIGKEKNIIQLKDVKIPFASVTCDTITMKECVCVSKKYNFSDKNKEYIYDISLAKAVRASMSFPGIYTTCNFEKYNFIDGGTKNNLPVQILKEMGADKIISISFDLDSYKPTNKITDVVIRALDIFSLNSVLEGRNASDVSCIVKTEDTSLLEINDTEAVMKAGYDAIMEHKEEILKLI